MRTVGKIVGILLFFAFLALPSVLIYLDQQNEKEQELIRQDIADYLVFSHSVHMRSYWAMSNIDNAMEAGRNSGDYGITTTYFPLYAKRASGQTAAALEEIESYRGSIPQQAQTSFAYLCDCINELDSLATSLKYLPIGVIPASDLLADSVITTWGSRQAVRDRFASRERSLSNIRQTAVTDGYDWVYEDMRLKALYDIRMDQGQTMFQSSYF